MSSTTCPDCGFDAATPAGLEVHYARTHGDTPEPAPRITGRDIAGHQLDDTWRDRARCADPDIDTNLFFPGHGALGAALQAQAVAICRQCPVVLDCAHEHLAERFGVWGGLGVKARQKLAPEAEAAGWVRPSRRIAPHGTSRRYRAGCRCDQCRIAGSRQRATWDKTA